jgi:glutathione S-transferase
MSLVLHFHPLSSFCHKVLVALYESGTPFTAQLVNLGDPQSRAAFLALSPLGKMPVLRDETRQRTIAETSIIIEYLDEHYPGAQHLLPLDAGERLDARYWDRLFDLYLQLPMQKIVADSRRPAGEMDPRGVADASATIATAYRIVDERMRDRTWAAGSAFSIADCAAVPALFYASIVAPFPDGHPHLSAYFERLLARPSVKRVLEEARPYFKLFPMPERIPARFRGHGN